MDSDDLIPIDNAKPLRADALRNRKHLLRTASALFDAQSIADVTMSAIAKEADVGKGTLYRHFSTKAEILHALLDEDMRHFQEETLLRLRNSRDPLGTLRWFLATALEWVVDHSAMLHEVASQEPFEMLQHPAHLWWRQTILGLLQQTAADGDLAYIADLLYVMLDVRTIRFQQVTRGYAVERIATGLHTTLNSLIASSSE